MKPQNLCLSSRYVAASAADFSAKSEVLRRLLVVMIVSQLRYF